MSTSHETIDVFNPGIGKDKKALLHPCRSHLLTFSGRSTQIGHNQYPPQSAQNQPLNGVSDFVDGSGPIFSMYLEMATEEDKKMAENWKADADGILIFVRLYPLLYAPFTPTHRL
jgi:hypothetical protein